MHESLSIFHPIIGRWFAERVGTPTAVQAAAWPVIASGRHALVTAPTGSGKTLTAFLWAINQLATGAWPRGRLRVLYISPLKALNNDVRRNLLTPLFELRGAFERAGEPFPEVDVATRSGDTEQSERQRMVRRPPEVLITTPESLNLLLSSPRARAMLSNLETVILDEIHFVFGDKRGTHLITAVDRLVPLSGEFQRVALSATIKPLSAVADFVGGYELRREGGTAEYVKRPVEVIAPEQRKDYEVRVRFLGAAEDNAPPAGGLFPYWRRLAVELKRIIARNQSTLLFTNNRRLCERLSMLINEDEDHLIAYSHHGSLSREMRAVVEQRLKHGELKAIVATSSLELGIDIGALDEVVLIETPMTVSSAVQRVGRAGHQVGAVSRGILFPVHGRDLVNAAVAARGILERDIEPVRPVTCPLDVLAQVIVSMAGIEKWDLDALYDALRASWPFHGLIRKHFDLVVDMLAGRYEDSRLRALQPLVAVDRIDNTIADRPGALRTLYSSGGTIPDRGYFTMRHAATKAKIGELDEEFVWERRIGHTFALGLQSWRVSRITHSDVFVEPVAPKLRDVPFWRAEEINRGAKLSAQVGAFLEWAEERMDDPDWPDALGREYGLAPEAAGALVSFLRLQRNTTRCDLPHRHHVLIEYFHDQDAPEEGTRVMIHTLWGARVNRPFAAALAEAWEARFHQHLEVSADNDGLLVGLPEDAEGVDFFALVPPEDVEVLLRRRLEQTGFFGARFRENAARALLLPRAGFNKRTPLWLTRLRAKRLFEAAARYDDFPILIETWRTCLHDEFELPELKIRLEEIRSGATRCTEARTAAPSPFVRNGLWRLTNQLMYEDDTPVTARVTNLSDELLREAVFDAELRPEIPEAVLRDFERKAQRVFPGYAPGSPSEVLEWVKERLFIPESEWKELQVALKRDHKAKLAEWIAEIAPKTVRIAFAAGGSGIAALENLPRMARAFAVMPEAARAERLDGEPVTDAFATPPDPDEADATLEEWLGEWLRFYGPVTRDRLLSLVPIDAARIDAALASLAEAEAIVVLPEGAVCDSENMEMLLRLTRAAARPDFEPLPIERLPLFLARQQAVAGEDGETDGVYRVLERLFGYPMPAHLLESEFLPARLRPYRTSMLDVAMTETDLAWYGCEKGRIALTASYSRELFVQPADSDNEKEALWADVRPRLFADVRGRYDFMGLLRHTGLSVAELTDSLWEFVWNGHVANDSFAALRKGIENDYKAVEVAEEHRRSFRRRLGAWKASQSYRGNWFAFEPVAPEADALDREELNKERVRVLLDRYGILFRELLAQEAPSLRWGALFRALRLMELAGEIVAGCFFEEIPGLQFISPRMLRELQAAPDQDRVWWINAADPASLCGIDIKPLKRTLPKRIPSTHLVYQGTDLVLVSRRNGKDLDFRVPPDHPRLGDYVAVLDHLLTRDFQPEPSIGIATINGIPAPKSPYLPRLRDHFEVTVDWKKATLWRGAVPRG